MRKKELLTWKEDLDTIIDNFIENGLIQVRGDEENAALQIVNKINSSQISPSHENLKKTTYSRMKEKTVLHWKLLRMTKAAL